MVRGSKDYGVIKFYFELGKYLMDISFSRGWYVIGYQNWFSKSWHKGYVGVLIIIPFSFNKFYKYKGYNVEVWNI